MTHVIANRAEYTLGAAQAKVNQKLELCEHNIAYCGMVKSEVSGVAYNKDTRDAIKARSEQMQKKFGDFRSAMLQASKKKDLIETIVKVCERTISIEQERMKELHADLSKIDARIEEQKAYEKRQDFVERLHAYKEEYVRGFDTVAQGIRGWDCLVDLAESGEVHEGNIEKYGIDLNVPPENKRKAS